MVDMWMLSVAAALIDPVDNMDSNALERLETLVRSVPGLGEDLDAARVADADATVLRAEVLANGLKAAYEAGGSFEIALDMLWRETLFGTKSRNPRNSIQGTVTGNVIQGRDISSVSF